MHLISTATAPTHIYTLSLHDALPICRVGSRTSASGEPTAHRMQQAARRDEIGDGLASDRPGEPVPHLVFVREDRGAHPDRKSTRLNSSHRTISYAVFCLKKKKKAYRI